MSRHFFLIGFFLCAFTSLSKAESESVCTRSKNRVSLLVFKEPQGSNSEFSSGRSFVVICENKLLRAWAFASVSSDLGTFPVLEIEAKSDRSSVSVIRYGTQKSSFLLSDGDLSSSGDEKGIQSVIAEVFVSLLQKYEGKNSGAVQVYGNSLFTVQPELTESDISTLESL